MKKFFRIFALLILTSAMLILQGCPESASPSDTSDTGIVELFNSTNGGTIKTTNGAEITIPAGAIATKTDGSQGSVSFSIEPNIKAADLPLPIPAGYKLIGSIYGFGPSSFMFNEPLQIYLPAGSESSPENLSITWYNDTEKQWILLPINDIDAVNKRLGASVFELGYFAVVKIEITSGWSGKGEIQDSKNAGGIRYSPNTSDYYYTLSVKAVQYKYPEIGWPNLIGYNCSTGSYPTGGPLPETRMGNIPQGDYTIEVSRVKRGTLSSLPGERETYSNPAQITVTGFTVVGGWDWYNWTGWNDLSLSGGQWMKGDPSTWPKATIPFGTGQFQATLSWINTSSNNTDLDLHLFGPDNLHVYFSNEVSDDGSLMLDVDWMEETGSAVENIFSTKNMPKGDYKVYVDTFSGDVPKSFEVRIIRQGSLVKTYRGTATKVSVAEQDMILIQTFTIN
ncbi:MAG: hypothetical protein RO257_01805 [Candidatus Kapabacteria bacterium]|nr:hypothetical protein [Candidatus Kapabacteria bacterium]